MKEQFINKRFSKDSMDVIENADIIIREYEKQGYKLTLRQLYYQFVSRDLIPNNIKSYKRLGTIINDARLAGLIDWEQIDDLSRTWHKRTSWNSPDEIINAAASNYHIDRWRFSSSYVEVWVEKEALVNIVQRACYMYDTPYMACKGYPSQTVVYDVSKRFYNERLKGKSIHLIYLGDHDPSGIDITRDIRSRLNTFGIKCEVNRIALNMNQVEDYNPPPNPAKLTDTRSTDYISKFGDESWELDALEPSVIKDLITDNIYKLVNKEEWQKAVDLEDEGLEKLKNVIENIDDID